MDLDEIQLTCEEAMEKAVNYLKTELRGMRTGRASTALVEYLKIDYFGSPTELRSLALITVPEPSQIVVKPFDPSSAQTIVKGIASSGLGLNPMSDGKVVRVNVPALSGERRAQLVATVKQMAEQAKVSARNARRDANKHIDQAEKDKTLHISEDQAADAKDEVQSLLKKYEKQIDESVNAKVTEIQEV